VRTRDQNGENSLHVGAGLLARPTALEKIINMIKQPRWSLHLKVMLCEKDIDDVTPKDAAIKYDNLVTEKLINRELERHAVSE
jgi:hypothetical protein